MGSGILAGLLRNRIAKKDQIFIFDIDPAKGKSVSKKYGVRRASGIADLVKKVSVILLAVKPQDLETVGKEAGYYLTSRHRVITILAGVPVGRIQRELGRETRVIRAMPNLAATVGQAVTVVTASNVADRKLAKTLFSGCGRVLELSERYFDLVTALSGSGPAYFFYLIEHLVKAGVRWGLSEAEATLLATQTAKGAAELVLSSPHSAATLRTMVTSKGGTTEAALTTLEKNGFPQIFALAIENAVKRAKELGKG